MSLPIVRSTFRERVQNRVLAGAAIQEAGFVSLGSALPAANEAASARLAERVGLVGALLVLGGFAAAAGASLLSEEMRSGRAAALVARPVRRSRNVLARLAGLGLALLVLAAVVGLAHGATMALLVREPASRDAVTSRRAAEPSRLEVFGEGEAQRLVVEFPEVPSSGVAASLCGVYSFAANAPPSERQLTLLLRFLDVPGSSVIPMLARPLVPFEVAVPARTEGSAGRPFRVEVDIAPGDGEHRLPTLDVRRSGFRLLLEPVSRTVRIAKASALIFLSSLTVAALACAASAIVSGPVALAVALVMLLLGHAPHALSDAARLVGSRRPSALVAAERSPRRDSAPRVERVVLVRSAGIPDLGRLWPGQDLDRGADVPWLVLLSRVRGAWPQAAVALLLGLAAFSRRDL